MRHATFASILVIATVLTASAENAASGIYLCSVEQRAGIGSTHVSDDAPASFTDESPHYRFRIQIVEEGETQRVVELAYDGADRSRSEWHTPNSTLHAPYVGVGGEFHATEDLAFLYLSPARPGDGRRAFYHAGFEYPGSVDTVLSTRFGYCLPER